MIRNTKMVLGGPCIIDIIYGCVCICQRQTVIWKTGLSITEVWVYESKSHKSSRTRLKLKRSMGETCSDLVERARTGENEGRYVSTLWPSKSAIKTKHSIAFRGSIRGLSSEDDRNGALHRPPEAPPTLRYIRILGDFRARKLPHLCPGIGGSIFVLF